MGTQTVTQINAKPKTGLVHIKMCLPKVVVNQKQSVENDHKAEARWIS